MQTLKEYMNSLWAAKGRKIFTKEYYGVIESVRVKYGKDLSVTIRLPDGSVKLRDGTGLYAERAGVQSELGELI
jgi:hypothetical protein